MPGASTNKILFIPSWYPNRTDFASGNFIKRLIETDSAFDNVAVLFVVPDPGLEKNSEIFVSKEEGIYEVIIYYPKVVGRGFLAPLSKVIRRFKAYQTGMKELSVHWGFPQLVNVQVAYPAVLYAWWLKIRHKIHYILTEHGAPHYIFKPTSLTGKFLFRLQKFALQKAKQIITVSNYLAEAMRNRGIKNNYTVIPEVVPLPVSLPDLKPPTDKKVLLHISTLAGVKNVKGILHAIKQVSLYRKDFELIIVAEEIQQKEFILYSKTLGLHDTFVKFRNYITDTNSLLELILSSNFMVMFSNYETFSVVLAESLWAGRPVITSKCGGPQEFVSEDFGILVNPGDEKGLENAINKMLDTWQLYDSKKMREFALDNFAPTIIGKKMHLIHSEVIDSIKNT